MASAAQTLHRLLGALEDLVSQEEILLGAADYAGLCAAQDRSAPLVVRLADLAAQADTAAQERVAGVVARRTRIIGLLGTDIARARAELSEMAASQHRAARIAPVYRSLSAPIAGQWSAVG
jgi:hypothetical protein